MISKLSDILHAVKTAIDRLDLGLTVKITPEALTVSNGFVPVESPGVILIYAGSTYYGDKQMRADGFPVSPFISKQVQIVINIGLKKITNELALLDICETIESDLSYVRIGRDIPPLFPQTVSEPIQDGNFAFWRQINFQTNILVQEFSE